VRQLDWRTLNRQPLAPLLHQVEGRRRPAVPASSRRPDGLSSPWWPDLQRGPPPPRVTHTGAAGPNGGRPRRGGASARRPPVRRGRLLPRTSASTSHCSSTRSRRSISSSPARIRWCVDVRTCAFNDQVYLIHRLLISPKKIIINHGEQAYRMPIGQGSSQPGPAISYRVRLRKFCVFWISIITGCHYQLVLQYYTNEYLQSCIFLSYTN